MSESAPDAPDQARDALVERLFLATVGTLELYSVYLGWRLGLYRALRDTGPLTPDELAAGAGIDSRYAREWLEQQAVAGLIEVADAHDDPARRRYGLPLGHAEVLVEPSSSVHVAPFAPMVVGVAGALPEVVEAYRTGAGVPYAHYGPDFRDGQGGINRPAFEHELAGWVRAIPEVHARLQAEPPAKVADLGCGQGYSTLALARAYPTARIVGVDVDPASIADASRLADGSDTTAEFLVADAAGLVDSGPYDLVCVLEALHDMAYPVDVLAAIRAALAPGGAVLIADERVADAFAAPGDEVERVMYGWSVAHCLPSSRTEPNSAALGTVLRTGTVRELAAAAGFGSVDVLPVANDFLRLYSLRP